MSVKMSMARLVRPDMPAEIIDIKNYDPVIHKGFLLCIFCDAQVHYNKGAETRLGDNAFGARPHFVTNPGQVQIHIENGCPNIPKLKEGRIKRKYDSKAGFRFNLNLGMTDAFNHSSAYHVREDGKVKTASDIALMEPVSIRSASDFLPVFEKEDPARIRESVVIHQGFVLPWQEFFLKPKSDPRDVANIVNRLRQGARQPVLLGVSPVAKPRLHSFNGQEKSHLVTPCTRYMISGNQAVFPAVCVNNTPAMRRAGLLDKDFWKGDPVILSRPRVSFGNFEGMQAVYLIFNINSPNQVARPDWEKIVHGKKPKTASPDLQPA
jgi:hypothetical protein